MHMMNQLEKLLRKLRAFIESFYNRSSAFGDDEFGIINPRQDSIPYQIIVPHDYEVTDKKKLALLRTHDYINLGERG